MGNHEAPGNNESSGNEEPNGDLLLESSLADPDPIEHVGHLDVSVFKNCIVYWYPGLCNKYTIKDSI